MTIRSNRAMAIQNLSDQVYSSVFASDLISSWYMLSTENVRIDCIYKRYRIQRPIFKIYYTITVVIYVPFNQVHLWNVTPVLQ